MGNLLSNHQLYYSLSLKIFRLDSGLRCTPQNSVLHYCCNCLNQLLWCYASCICHFRPCCCLYGSIARQPQKAEHGIFGYQECLGRLVLDYSRLLAGASYVALVINLAVKGCVLPRFSSPSCSFTRTIATQWIGFTLDTLGSFSKLRIV
jgi:hypothetical protein